MAAKATKQTKKPKFIAGVQITVEVEVPLSSHQIDEAGIEAQNLKAGDILKILCEKGTTLLDYGEHQVNSILRDS